MKRYYMSIIDFSEIENITTDENRIKELKNQMQKEGLLTEKGNPSYMQITAVVKQTSERFLNKLSKRIQNRDGGIEEVYNIFRMLEQRKEFIALYLYLAFLYGFIEWRVPRKIELLSSNRETLKMFFAEFLIQFDGFLKEKMLIGGI